MKTATEIKKEGRVWSWEVRRGKEEIRGGYCRTKSDAANDARIAKNLFSPESVTPQSPNN